MQVTKLRVANDNGLIPAGRYFARLAHNLRAANAAAVVDEYEAQERELETRYRRRRATNAGRTAPMDHTAMV